MEERKEREDGDMDVSRENKVDFSVCVSVCVCMCYQDQDDSRLLSGRYFSRAINFQQGTERKTQGQTIKTLGGSSLG